jgi:acyl-CoA synthetase (AMP-forming)/AMP-acid ligase II
MRALKREQLNYARLWRQVEIIAEIFDKSAGKVVAVALPHGPDLALAILGASLRCVCAPINPLLPVPQIRVWPRSRLWRWFVQPDEKPAIVAARFGKCEPPADQ